MIELHVDAGVEAAQALTQIKLAALRFPGERALTVVVHASYRAEPLRMVLGSEWRYDGSPACVSALSEFGRVVTPDATPGA